MSTLSSTAATVDRNPWRVDKPPVGHMVEVWVSIVPIVASWTGTKWRTSGGMCFSDGEITHWRESMSENYQHDAPYIELVGMDKLAAAQARIAELEAELATAYKNLADAQSDVAAEIERADELERQVAALRARID